ncbi:hypothetical protein [Pedobacter sp.]|jgi:hypothetical protein|nr:hypothetical protein [Pedobacter sp.]HWW37841.1 hypothetical protein [Pedobacter sp.]
MRIVDPEFRLSIHQQQIGIKKINAYGKRSFIAQGMALHNKLNGN